MKRFLIMALAGVVALGLGSAAYAVECALDAVPASTLLFPFVQYDYEQGMIDDSGQTTLFAITNVSSEAQIVHITLWTDFSIAILDFNLTMTGYDVQTINIRDILREGRLPSGDVLAGEANEWWDFFGTLPTNAGGTPFDDGPYSSFNELNSGALDAYFLANGLRDPWSTFPLDCEPGTGPGQWISSPVNYREDPNGDGNLADSGVIPPGTLDIFQGYLQTSQTVTTGYANCAWAAPVVFTNGTWFTNQAPRATWMYITADVVNSCNKDLPDGAALQYFSTAPTSRGVRVANVLMGDVLWLDSGNNYSEADNAVHLEASMTPFSPIIPGPENKNATFYHNLHGGLAGTADYREPLPSAWGFRYMNAAPVDAFTWIRAWRGSMLNAVVSDLRQDVLGTLIIDDETPAALWSNSCVPYTYYAWDEDENVNSVGPGFVPPWSGGPTDVPIPVPNLFPLETQEVAIDEFFIVDIDHDGNSFGWMMVIWGSSNGYTVDQYQSWMGVKYAAFGQYTAGLSGAVLANFNCDNTQVLPTLGIGLP